MKRKLAWSVVAAALLSGTSAQAQGVLPYGAPTSRPTMPYGSFLPGGPMPPGRQGPQPAYDGNGPKAGAAEPYIVPTEPTEPKATSRQLPKLPAADPSPGVMTTEPIDPAGYLEPMGPPSEPYTVYEGPRSLAEMKQDDTRVWAHANFIHWWIRRDSTPPLFTTGDPINPGPRPGPGTLGNTDTQILLGDGPIGPKEFSGVQSTVGMWLDDERTVALEAGGFWVGKNSRQYSFSSDNSGTPVISQPVNVDGIEMRLAIATPGSPALPPNLQGAASVSTIMDFHGAELNLTRNAIRSGGFTFDYFAGVRYLYMNETLTMNQSITVLPAADFVETFNGISQPMGTNFRLYDYFNVNNRFYGGQVGARFDWAWRSLDIGAILKFAAGVTAHQFTIDGSSTLNAIDGTRTTLQGGTLAQTSNIGRVTSTDFSVVPELTVTGGYQITPWMRLTAGYTLLYWSRVERIGNNIDRSLDPNQAPTTAFPAIAPGVRPVFPAIRTEFWAQGVNVGVELKY